VLKRGNPEFARRAVRHVLLKGDRGREEALRLAREMSLRGFEAEALAIAQNRKPDAVEETTNLPQSAGRPARGAADQILRVRAILYLQVATGAVRRRLLGMLDEPNNDLRLAAIQMFAPRAGLTDGDLDEIGPALTRVALEDRSMGHRQEAIHALERGSTSGRRRCSRSC